MCRLGYLAGAAATRRGCWLHALSTSCGERPARSGMSTRNRRHGLGGLSSFHGHPVLRWRAGGLLSATLVYRETCRPMGWPYRDRGIADLCHGDRQSAGSSRPTLSAIACLAASVGALFLALFEISDGGRRILPEWVFPLPTGDPETASPSAGFYVFFIASTVALVASLIMVITTVRHRRPSMDAMLNPLPS